MSQAENDIIAAAQANAFENEKPKARKRYALIGIGAMIAVTMIFLLIQLTFRRGDPTNSSTNYSSVKELMASPEVGGKQPTKNIISVPITKTSSWISARKWFLVSGIVVGLAVLATVAYVLREHLLSLPVPEDPHGALTEVSDLIGNETSPTLVEPKVEIRSSKTWIETLLSFNIFAQIAIVFGISMGLRILLVLGSLSMAYIYGPRSFHVDSVGISVSEDGLNLTLSAGLSDASWQQFLHFETLKDTSVSIYMPVLLPESPLVKVKLPAFKFAKGSTMLDFSEGKPVNIKIAERIPLQRFYNLLKKETKNFKNLRGYKLSVSIFLEGDFYTTMLPVPLRLQGPRKLLEYNHVIEPSPKLESKSEESDLRFIEDIEISSDEFNVDSAVKLDLDRFLVPIPLVVSSKTSLVKFSLSGVGSKKLAGLDVSLTNGGTSSGKITCNIRIALGDGNSLNSIIDFLTSPISESSQTLRFELALLNSQTDFSDSLFNLLDLAANAKRSMHSDSIITKVETAADLDTSLLKKVANVDIISEHDTIGAKLTVTSKTFNEFVPFIKFAKIKIWPNFQVNLGEDAASPWVSIDVSTEISSDLIIQAKILFANKFVENQLEQIMNTFMLPPIDGKERVEKLKLCIGTQRKISKDNLIANILASFPLCIMVDTKEKGTQVHIDNKPLTILSQLKPAYLKHGVVDEDDDDQLLQIDPVVYSMETKVERHPDSYLIDNVVDMPSSPPVSGPVVSLNWPELQFSLAMESEEIKAADNVKVVIPKNSVNYLLAGGYDPVSLFFNGRLQVNIEAKHKFRSVIFETAVGELKRVANQEEAEPLAIDLVINFGGKDRLLRIPPLERLLDLPKSAKPEKISTASKRDKTLMDVTLVADAKNGLLPVFRFFQQKHVIHDWIIEHSLTLPSLGFGATVDVTNEKLGTVSKLGSMSVSLPKTNLKTSIGKGGKISVSGISLEEEWKSENISGGPYLPINLSIDSHPSPDVRFDSFSGMIETLSFGTDFFGEEKRLRLKDLRLIGKGLGKRYGEMLRDLDNQKYEGFRKFLRENSQNGDILSGNLVIDSQPTHFSIDFDMKSTDHRATGESLIVFRQKELSMNVGQVRNNCWLTFKDVNMPIKVGGIAQVPYAKISANISVGCRFDKTFDSGDVRKFILNAFRGTLSENMDVNIRDGRNEYKPTMAFAGSYLKNVLKNNAHLLSNLRVITPKLISDSKANNDREDATKKTGNGSVALPDIDINIEEASLGLPIFSDMALRKLTKIMTLGVDLTKTLSSSLDGGRLLSSLPFPHLIKQVKLTIISKGDKTFGISIGQSIDPVAQVSIPEFKLSLMSGYSSKKNEFESKCENCGLSAELFLNPASLGVSNILESFDIWNVDSMKSLPLNSELVKHHSKLESKDFDIFKSTDSTQVVSVPKIPGQIIRLGNDSEKDALSTVICGMTVDIFINDLPNLISAIPTKSIDELNISTSKESVLIPEVTVDDAKSTVQHVLLKIKIPIENGIPVQLKLGSIGLQIRVGNHEVVDISLKSSSLGPSTRDLVLSAKIHNQTHVTAFVNNLINGKPIDMKISIAQIHADGKIRSLSIPFRMDSSTSMLQKVLDTVIKAHACPPSDRLKLYTGLITAGPEPQGDIPAFLRITNVDNLAPFSGPMKLSVYFGPKPSIVPPFIKFNLALLEAVLKLGSEGQKISLQLKPNNGKEGLLIRESWLESKKPSMGILSIISLLPLGEEDKKKLEQLADDEGYDQNYKDEFFTVTSPDLHGLLSLITNRKSKGGMCMSLDKESYLVVKLGSKWELKVDLSGIKLPILADFFGNPCNPLQIAENVISSNREPKSIHPNTNWMYSVGLTDKSFDISLTRCKKEDAKVLLIKIDKELTISIDGVRYSVGENEVNRQALKLDKPALFELKYSSFAKELIISSRLNGENTTRSYMKIPLDLMRLFEGQPYRISQSSKSTSKLTIPPVEFNKTKILYGSDYPKLNDNSPTVYFTLSDSLNQHAIIDDLCLKVMSEENHELDANYSLDRLSGLYKVSFPSTVRGHLKLLLSTDCKNWKEVKQTIYFPDLK